MTTISESLEEAWKEAARDAGNKQGFYRRRLSPPCPDFTFAGVNRPDGLRQVTFELVPISSLLPLAERSKGYRVAFERPSPDRMLVHISEVGRNSSDGIFATLCCDLVTTISTIPDLAAATVALVRRIHHWKLFFQRNPDGALSREDGIGLFAEIAFLDTCLSSGFDPDFTIESWKGPLAGNQDFSFGEQAVEVKGTTANDLNQARISNIRQLDTTGLSLLFLRHSAYDLRDGAGILLQSTISGLRNRLATAPSALLEFEGRLLATGYLEPVAGIFATHGFTLRRHRHFRVTDGFPRITESNIDPGISDASYVIELSACGEFELPGLDVIDSLQRSFTK